MNFEYKIVSSLEKIFPETELNAAPLTSGRALRGEVYSFQIAFRLQELFRAGIIVDITGDMKDCIQLRQVQNMPSDYPVGVPDDHDILKEGKAGVYPDLLMPLFRGNMMTAANDGKWIAIWVTVRVPENMEPGTCKLAFHFHFYAADKNDPELHVEFPLTVLPQKLPPQKMFVDQWLYADCISHYYRVPCWSGEHWALLEKYFRNATEHGLDTLLTPLWTPPLDTAVGSERPTVQLLDIEKSGDNFLFRFDKLERFLNLAMKCGFKRFQMSHAFSQWGVKFTPKIMVRVNNQEIPYFGWHVPADSPEYATFLRQLMNELLPFLRNMGLEGKVWFSISDEPTEKCLKEYTYASNLMRGILQGFPTLEALSSYEFYEKGLIENPIPDAGSIDAFAGKVKNLYTYYCCGGYLIPNRFFAMTSARNRVMGTLMYYYGVKGFLHWGYNFWYTVDSLNLDNNPFCVTDGGRSFPSGDAFLVYPGPEGPLDSIRYEVFREALQDVRLLNLAEEKIGRDAVLAMIERGISSKITMKQYPCSAEWLLNLRDRILDILR